MLGKILIELRSGEEISQAELAKRTGISQSAIAKWELGQSQATEDNIVILAKYFNVSADFLLGLEDEFGNKI